jgi:hypothetical protein
VKAWRIILASAGVGLALFGAYRLITEVPLRSVLFLAVWMLAALVIHDGVLSPFVVTVGWLLRRLLPDRGRRFVQVGLIVAGLVTVIALPLIGLRGSQPAAKGLLLRDYGANLTLIIGVVAVVTLGLYAVRVARDRTSVADPVPRAPSR